MSKLYQSMLLLGSTMLSGCASYAPPAGVPVVPLAIYMNNDSTATTMLQGMASASADDKCKPLNTYKDMLGIAMHMKPVDSLSTVQIPAGAPFTFSVGTVEARFARNTGCSATATFLPEAGNAYRVLYTSRNNAAACDLVISDRYNRAVAFRSPEYSCLSVTSGVVKSGVGWAKEFRITITPGVK